jgi:cytochrome c-type biogenesis protein CcmF
MVLATITLLISGLVITLGTSAPLLTRVMENPGQVGPSFYNRVNLPIALLVALLLSLVPYLTWRGSEPKDVLRKMIAPLLFSAAVTVGAFVWQVKEPLHVLFVFLAALALASNLQKTLIKMRAGGLQAAGGYLSHVGVGVILLGILASSAYDESTKVTLEQGVAKKVDGMTLTFAGYVPGQGREKDSMAVEVVDREGKHFLVHPKMFVNERTRQVMVNPDIRSTLVQDLYVSPIDFDPGQPQLQLAKGQSGHAGKTEVKFVGFDLNAEGNAMAQMAKGGMVTIGTIVEVKQADGTTTTVKPLYRLNPASGQVETPSMPLPGGGAIHVSGINASDGQVRFEMSGVSNPARLSIDVTRKPLINLVWYGLYVVLLGGALATVQRLRQAMKRDEIQQAG